MSWRKRLKRSRKGQNKIDPKRLPRRTHGSVDMPEGNKRIEGKIVAIGVWAVEPSTPVAQSPMMAANTYRTF